MDDTRIEWMKHVIYKGLNLVDNDIFLEFLERNDNENELELAKFLNDSPKDEYQILIFYKTFYEEEVEEILEIPRKQSTNGLTDVDGEVLYEQTNNNLDNSEEMTTNRKEIPDEITTNNNNTNNNEMNEKGDDSPIDETDTSLKYTTIINRKTIWRTRLSMKNTSVDVQALTEEYVYFIRITKGYINAPNDLKQTFKFMPSQMQWGYMRGSFLQNLQNLLRQIYSPLLKDQQLMLHENNQYQQELEISEKDQSELSENKIKEQQENEEMKQIVETKDEFLINTRKFCRIVETTIHQLNSDIVLEVPNIDVTEDDLEIVKTSKFIIIEKTIISWNRQIRQTLDILLEKKPSDNSPLSLIDYWRDRNLILGTLIEQLKRSNVIRFYHLHQILENDTYNALFSETNSLYVQARDNVKFLSLLERHFKTLTFGNKIESLIDIIHPLIQTFHMIWVLSRYYNRDENMVQLFERTALAITNRVIHAVNFPNVFRSDLKQSISLMKTIINLLNHWKNVYYEKRSEIETVGRDARWEFDKVKLFGYTDYTCLICENLLEILITIKDFRNIFSSELKSVTCDTKKIDEASQRVNNMIEMFCQMKMDPFNKENKNWWYKELEKFHNLVEHLEYEANSLINDSFTLLRSSESVFDVWCKFRHIKTRSKIHNLLNEKFIDILKQYEKELINISSIFHQNAILPPFHNEKQNEIMIRILTKFIPPISGLIQWERYLLNCIKKPILKFLKINELMKNDEGKSIRNQYIIIGKQMKNYEEQLYKYWLIQIEQSFDQYLNQTLLKQQDLIKSSMITRISSLPISRLSLNSSSKSEQNTNELSRIAMEFSKYELLVNFHPNILVTITEAKHLEALGFKIPEIVINAVMKESSYIVYVEKLKFLVKRCHELFTQLDPVELTILESYIINLRTIMKPGWDILNWKSLGINEFITKVEEELNRFASVCNLCKKTAADIEARLELIGSADLFPTPKWTDEYQKTAMGEYFTCKEYFAQTVIERQKQFEELRMQHTSLTPLIIKLEGAITQQNTGNSKIMVPYFEYWEKKLFDRIYAVTMQCYET
ncbi:unnamed protein product [Schistosoma curassoni]|uniref:DHC_N1 domain-containing protein n=1 Tax=Schistosoma curassoni TaxID=6186 RepID=A0A183K0M0_9TREM|nr:unnamed protein product [Schistosoma curassoni]